MILMRAILPLLIGFVLDGILGDPYSLPHPVRLMGRTVAALEKLVRRLLPGRERAAGTLTALTVLLIWTAAPAVLLVFFYRLDIRAGIAAESVMCYYLLAARCLENESMKVCRALESGDTEAARRAVSMIVGRDTERLDAAGITRAAVETVAENTSDGVTAPMMFIAIGGAAAGFFYKAANTMDSMLGYKNEKYIDFGRFAAKLDDVLNFIPSRLTALIMVAAAFILGFDGGNAFHIWRRDRLKHPSPNSAQTESVMAGALGIELAGDASYFGTPHKKPVIGDPRRPIEAADIRRANRLMYATSLMTLILTVAVKALAGVML